MPRALHRTWVALAVAALAVLVVAALCARDFAHNVFAECPGSLIGDDSVPSSSDDPGPLVAIPLDADPATMSAGVPAFELKYETKKPRRSSYGLPTFENVRVVWKQLGRDGAPCACGSMPIALGVGEPPEALRLYRGSAPDTYVVKRFASPEEGGRGILFGRDTSIRGTFRVASGSPVQRLQADRIFTRQHLPGLVVVVALGALVVALLRSRRAMSYALRIHTWNEAVLTHAGLIESTTGTVLGSLERTRQRHLEPGPVLIAPEALVTSGLYRDMATIPRRSVAEGTHSRWATGTAVRLRDARALAVISTLCTLLAFGARLVA